MDIFDVFAGFLILIIFHLLSKSDFVIKAQRKAASRLPFKGKKFLTGNEIEFFGRLKQAVGSDAVIQCQVSMGALIDVDSALDKNEMWKYRDLYSRKIIDYVLCHPKTMKPFLIVELDDITHDKQKDAIRDSYTKAVGLKTLRFESKKKPSVATLRKMIFG